MAIEKIKGAVSKDVPQGPQAESEMFTRGVLEFFSRPESKGE